MELIFSVSCGDFMKSLILVTHNKGKFSEANEIAKRYGVVLKMPGKGLGKFKIQADTVTEVSRFSAVEAFGKIKQPLIVDDSGLFVDRLNGFQVCTRHKPCRQ